MSEKAFQDFYSEDTAVCYGCGRLNEHGLHVKSYWDESSGEGVAYFTPKPYHTAVKGYVYGGLLASLIDCHATGTAMAVMYREAGRELGTEPVFRFVTGTLNVRFLAPTPITAVLELRARTREIKGRRVVLEVDILAEGVNTVYGEVVVFQMPDDLIK